MVCRQSTLAILCVFGVLGCAGDSGSSRDAGNPDGYSYDTYFPPLGDTSDPNPTCTGFGFAPNPPLSATEVTVSYQHTVPYSYVDLVITGPGTTTNEWIGVTGGNGTPYQWSWKVTFSAPGSWQVKFTAEQLDDEADKPVCAVQVVAPG